MYLCNKVNCLDLNKHNEALEHSILGTSMNVFSWSCSKRSNWFWSHRMCGFWASGWSGNGGILMHQHFLNGCSHFAMFYFLYFFIPKMINPVFYCHISDPVMEENCYLALTVCQLTHVSIQSKSSLPTF